MRLHAWDLPPGRFDRLLRDLCFRFGKWDLHVGGRCRVLPVSLVLSRDEHETIVALAERFARVLRDVERKVGADADALEQFGIDRRLARWIDAETPRDVPAFGRGDFFLTPEGRWVLSEFNEDVPGGFNESYGLTQLLDASSLGGAVVGDLRQAILDAFASHDAVAMFYATAFSEDLQHALIVERWLADAGHPTAMGGPDSLRCGRLGGRPRVQGVPVDAAFRFYPGEWLADLPNARHWLRALPKFAMMNPLSRLVTQSKKSFAHFQTNGLISQADRTLIEAYLPHTRSFDASQVDAYLEQRDDWVLKAAFGRMGDAVLVGRQSDARTWGEAILDAAKTPTRFAMQARFDVMPLESAPLKIYPTVGAYVVNGRFAGYYSRAAEIPMITHEAYHVATVVEAA